MSPEPIPRHWFPWKEQHPVCLTEASLLALGEETGRRLQEEGWGGFSSGQILIQLWALQPEVQLGLLFPAAVFHVENNEL